MAEYKEDNPGADISRRNFLKSATGGGAVLVAATTLPIKGNARGNETRKSNNPFEEILNRCGSEFGDIRESN